MEAEHAGGVSSKHSLTELFFFGFLVFFMDPFDLFKKLNTSRGVEVSSKHIFSSECFFTHKPGKR